jgi:hypothetical protein
MPHAKRSTARSRLFSLSARFERGAEHDEDDGCPMCIAQRTGGDVMLFYPRPDGRAPKLPESYLIAEARKALARAQPPPGGMLHFIQYGTRLPDGTFAESSFSVDGEGRVFFTSPTEHHLVAQVPR